MVGRSCFFVGHRETPPELLPVLTYAIEQHISKYGVTKFIVGGYGSFDRLAAHAVIYAKQQHPQILLLRLIPYYSEAQSIELPRGFDGTFYPPGMEKIPRRVFRASIVSLVLYWYDKKVSRLFPADGLRFENCVLVQLAICCGNRLGSHHGEVSVRSRHLLVFLL